MKFDGSTGVIYQFPVSAPHAPVPISATDESGAVPVESGIADTGVKEAPRRFLHAARRDLTEQEAGSPAGLRWLTYDAERLDRECIDLRESISGTQERYDVLREQFHDKRVELETLRGKSSLSVRNELLSYLCISAGSAGLGATPSYLAIAAAHQLAAIGIVVSAVLVVGGIALRVWK